MATITGTSGNDDLLGTLGDDLFQLWQGGDDAAFGVFGDDIFNFAAAFTAADSVHGGAGDDTIRLSGDYSAGVAMAASTMSGVEQIQLGAGHSYNLTTVDANVAAGDALTLNAQALGAGDALVFNGAAESNGSFLFLGGAGNDVLTGGAGGDVFNLTRGGNDTVHGGGGDDTIVLGPTLSAGDHIDGGAGDDTLRATAGGDTIPVPGDFTSVENVGVTLLNNFGFNYFIDLSAASIGAGESLLIDGAAVKGDLQIHAELPAAGLISLIGSASGITTIFYGGNFDPADRIVGNNPDTLSTGVVIVGDYPNPIVLGPHTLENVGVFDLLADAFDTLSYSVVENDGNVGPGQTLLINAGSIPPFFKVDGSAETDGHLDLRSNAIISVLIGGAQSDHFLVEGGQYTVIGNAGDDVLANFNGALCGPGTVFDGGPGDDTLASFGAQADDVTFSPGNLVSVERLALTINHPTTITMSDGNMAPGATLFVAISFAAGTPAVTFNGAAEAQGHFDIQLGAGGSGDLTGGALSDNFDFHAATLAGESYTIRAFDFASDTVSFAPVAGADAAVTTGADPTSALTHLAPHHAVLFTPNTGSFPGQTFLVIDGNGIAGFQASGDIAIRLVGAEHIEDFASLAWAGS